MAAGCRCSSGSAHATATLLSTTTSVTGHLLQGSIGGIPAFESPRVVAIGADVVGSCQPIRIGCRQRRKAFDLFNSRATAGQLGAAVALDDRRRVWERADLPVLTGLPVAAGIVRRRRFGGPLPASRLGAPWSVRNQHQHAATLTLRLEFAGADLAPDRSFTPPKTSRRFRYAEFRCLCHDSDSMSQKSARRQGRAPSWRPSPPSTAALRSACAAPARCRRGLSAGTCRRQPHCSARSV